MHRMPLLPPAMIRRPGQRLAPDGAAASATPRPSGLSAKQAAAGRATAAARAARTRELVVGAALALAGRGAPATQAAVLAGLAGSGIRSVRTVRRHWAAVRSAMTPAAPDPGKDAPLPPRHLPEECRDLEVVILSLAADGHSPATIAAALALEPADVAALLG